MFSLLNSHLNQMQFSAVKPFVVDGLPQNPTIMDPK